MSYFFIFYCVIQYVQQGDTVDDKQYFKTPIKKSYILYQGTPSRWMTRSTEGIKDEWIFNGSLMNDAVYKFRRYEDSSLEYAGVNKHKGENIGLFDTVISEDDYIYGT